MTFEEYDSFVAQSGASDSSYRDQLIYCAIKLNGEAGEVAELVGKSMRVHNVDYASGSSLDGAAVVLELGDVLWYVSRLAALIGVSLEGVARVNREKLLARKLRGKDRDLELAAARSLIGGEP